ncbi:MAG TPA: enterochelin esterase, partial [Rhodanobacter sp.]|nr:enterochelin esterase [Rhodanobacter sp.]
MHRCRHIVASLLCLGLLSGVALARQDAPVVPAHRFFHIQLGAASAQPASGRLLLFATDAKAAIAAAKDGKVDEVDTSPFSPEQTSVAAREVSRLAPGQGVDIDADTLVFPAGYSQLPPGDYLVQAVLDVDHSYNYSGRGAGDLVSDV